MKRLTFFTECLTALAIFALWGLLLEHFGGWKLVCLYLATILFVLFWLVARKQD